MKIEIFGPEPPCARCKASVKNAKKAVEELDVDADEVKKDVMSKEAMELGISLPPALVIDGKIMKLGAVPTVAEVKAAIEKVREGLVLGDRGEEDTQGTDYRTPQEWK